LKVFFASDNPIQTSLLNNTSKRTFDWLEWEVLNHQSQSQNQSQSQTERIVEENNNEKKRDEETDLSSVIIEDNNLHLWISAFKESYQLYWQIRSESEFIGRTPLAFEEDMNLETETLTTTEN
jgi:hypothetical protein